MRSRPTPSDITLALLAVGLAALVHGPAGSLLARAMVDRDSVDLFLAGLGGLAWAVSGAILVAAILTIVWTLIIAWSSRR